MSSSFFIFSPVFPRIPAHFPDSACSGRAFPWHPPLTQKRGDHFTIASTCSLVTKFSTENAVI